MSEKEYDLKKVKTPLYRVIIDERTGKVVDGVHRLRENPEWPKEYVKSKDDAEAIIWRLQTNVLRRIVPAEEIKEWINELGEIYLKQGIKAGKIAKKVSEETNYSLRRVQEYLDKKYKARRSRFSETAGKAEMVPGSTAPIKKPRAATKSKYAEDRKKTRHALYKHYPEQRKFIREILRDTKPYLKNKKEIDRYYKLATNPNRYFTESKIEDPLSVFAQGFYLYDGPHLGWRFGIPWWIRLRLKAVIDQEGEPDVTPESLAIKILGDYTVEKGISNEETLMRARLELAREWLLEDEYREDIRRRRSNK